MDRLGTGLFLLAFFVAGAIALLLALIAMPFDRGMTAEEMNRGD